MKHNTSIEPLETRIAPAVIFAVEADTNKLVSFDSSAPGTLLSDITITGMAAGQVAGGIDFDQLTGTLYALAVKDEGATRSLQYYTLDPTTGAATPYQTTSSFGAYPDTSALGFEINGPILVITTTSDNIFGSGYFPDSTSSFGGTYDDPNSGESVTAIAYSQTFSGTSGNTLYGYNFTTDELVTFDGTSGSVTLSPVARAKLSGANFTANSQQMGFDIAAPYAGGEQGWLSLFKTTTGTHLYTMNLATAELTDLGAIGSGSRQFGGLTVSVDAPAPTISGKTATWTDLDGDNVTLTVSKGTLSPANFRMLAGTQGSFLGDLKLDATFSGADITLAAKRGPVGDGIVNIGSISAAGVDLGAVKVSGTIASITAGDAAAPAPSVKTLTVKGIDPESFGGQRSKLADGAGAILIKSDFGGALELGAGTTGSVTILGDLVGSKIVTGYIVGNGSLGKLIIKGNVIGNEGASGYVRVPTIKSVTVGGSIIGGDGGSSGVIESFGNVPNSITIGGSLIGGAGNDSGKLTSYGTTTIKIGGSLISGTGSLSGSIAHGGFSGASVGVLKSLTIGGSVYSADDNASQSNEYFGIFANRIGTVLIKGNVTGYADSPVAITARGEGAVTTQAGALAIGKVTIGGSVRFAHIGAGISIFSSFQADAAIGAVKIGGDLIASSITAGIDLVNKIAGDADDKFVGGNFGNAAIIAKIASVTIGGQLRGTAGGLPDSFGIIAEEIGSITVAKAKIPLTVAKDDRTLGFTSDVRVREL